MTLGEKIKIRRESLNLSQDQLAAILNVSKREVEKWEQNKTRPDIETIVSMGRLFSVTTDYLLIDNENTNSGHMVQSDTYTKRSRISDFFSRRHPALGIMSVVITLILVAEQTLYSIYIRPRGIEYVYSNLTYIFLGLTFLFGILSAAMLVNFKSKTKISVTVAALCAFILLSVFFPVFAENQYDETLDLSPDCKNLLVLKRDLNTQTVSYYSVYAGIFCREKTQFPYTVNDEMKLQWLTSDICTVTYQSPDGNTHQFVATYGERGNGISYLDPVVPLTGEWSLMDTNTANWKISVNSEGVIISNANMSETYTYGDCVPFGTTAVVLCEDGLPKWTIAMNKNCVIGENDLIQTGGTIQLCEVSMGVTSSLEFYCTTPKYDSYEEDYYQDEYDSSEMIYTNNGYRITDKIQFTSDAGTTWITPDMEEKDMNEAMIYYDGSISDNEYYISDDGSVIAFMFGEIPKVCVSSDNGMSWTLTSLDVSFPDVQKKIIFKFISFNSDGSGYVGLGTDYSPGTGEVKLCYISHDFGKTWEKKSLPRDCTSDLLNGISFCNGNVGIVSYMNQYSMEQVMPILYITSDGGNNWNELVLTLDMLNIPDLQYLNGLVKLSVTNDIYTLVLCQDDNDITVSLLSKDLISWSVIQ